jgi:hypothetical protein
VHAPSHRDERSAVDKPMSVPKRLSALERALFFYLPALVLAVSFVAVCIQAGTAWPWNRIVHEDAQHTLLATIFYFEHATRELVLDAVLALAVAGAVRHFYRPSPVDDEAAHMWMGFGIATVAALALILGGTAYVNAFGPDYVGEARGQTILDNLAQYPTRPGAAFAWGAHWRYHLIERFTEVALAFCVAGLVWLRDGRPASASRGATLYVVALAAFVVATAIFGVTALPFRDPVYLGHQLRELVTHTLVTLPLALGACFVLARRFSYSEATRRSSVPAWPIFVAGAVAVACGGYVLIGAVLLKAQAYGQKKALAELIFPHFFEHSLGYVFVSALAGFAYLWPIRSRRSSQHPT